MATEPLDDNTLGPHVSARLSYFKLVGTTRQRVKGVKLTCTLCGQSVQVESDSSLVHAAYANALRKQAGNKWHAPSCKSFRKK